MDFERYFHVLVLVYIHGKEGNMKKQSNDRHNLKALQQVCVNF